MKVPRRPADISAAGIQFDIYFRDALIYNLAEMKIYTKTGDEGMTSLFGGKRVSKDSLRVEANGAVDELNAQIGVIVADGIEERLAKKFLRIQGELFVLGGDLATPAEVKIKIPRITQGFVARLEREIDLMQKEVPALRNFILPGGSVFGSQIHLARAIARRAERSIAALSAEERINTSALMYINRLSDWLFVIARYVNKTKNQKETIWQGRGK